VVFHVFVCEAAEVCVGYRHIARRHARRGVGVHLCTFERE